MLYSCLSPAFDQLCNHDDITSSHFEGVFTVLTCKLRCDEGYGGVSWCSGSVQL